jgi:hypothetical protein
MWTSIESDFAGSPLHVEAFVASRRESEFAATMAEYQHSYPEMKFGSYPELTPAGWQVTIRVRGNGRELVQEAATRFMQELGGIPITAEERT